MENIEFNITNIDVYEEYSLKSEDNLPSSKKKFNPKIIIPRVVFKEVEKRDANIKKWHEKYRDDIDIVFNDLVSIYIKNRIIFHHTRDHIYDRFVRFMYNKHI
tara:strand:+ start:343 stop:651 length:309 start_codon:yes stop_codon:yes gene_type:complete